MGRSINNILLSGLYHSYWDIIKRKTGGFVSANIFEKRVEEHFDEYGEKYILLRERIYDPIFSFIQKVDINENHQENILEVGCGGGAFLIEMRHRYPKLCNFVGIDISSTLLKNLHKKDQIYPIKADVSFLPLRNSLFHHIIAGSLLHHLIESTPRLSYRKIIQSIHDFIRVLKRSGFILIYEEPVFSSKFISVFTFWVTRFLSFFSNRTPIVSFLTILDIDNLIEELKRVNKLALISNTKSIYKERSGGYLLEKLYYIIFNITYDVFIAFQKYE
jgi:ubiquinone/menaquinone biosynthesis C-methylase UbiE